MYGRSLSRGKANIVDSEAFVRNNIHDFESFVYGVHENIFLDTDIKTVLQSFLTANALASVRSKDIAACFAAENINTSMDKCVRLENSMTVHSMTVHSMADLSLEKQMKINGTSNIFSNVNLNVGKPIRTAIINEVFNDVHVVVATMLKTSIVKVLTSSMALGLTKQFRIHIANSIYANLLTGIEKPARADIITGLLSKAMLKSETKVKSEPAKTWLDIGQFNSGEPMPEFESLLKSDAVKISMNEIVRTEKDTFGLRVGIIKLTKISQIENLMLSDIENIILNDLFYTRIY